MLKEFEKWFDENYPANSFGELPAIMRDAIEEVALKAYKQGLREGHASAYDSELNEKISEFISG